MKRTCLPRQISSTLSRPCTSSVTTRPLISITRTLNGHDLTGAKELFVADDGSPAPRRARSARIGVDYAGAWADRKLRYYVPGNPYVSGKPR